jgi:hypothetical protein
MKEIIQFFLAFLFILAVARLMLRKFIDVSMWVLLFFVVYWYPVLLDELPYGFSSAVSVVNSAAKLHISLLLTLLLAFDIVFERYFKNKINTLQLSSKTELNSKDKLGRRLFLINWILLVICMIYLLPVAISSSSGDKASVMRNLGYVFKTFELLSLLVIARSANKGGLALLGCAFLVVFDFVFGMRFVAGIGLVAFFVAASTQLNGVIFIEKITSPIIVKCTFVIAILFALFFKTIYPFLVAFEFSALIEFIDAKRIALVFTRNAESNSFVIIFNEVLQKDLNVGFLFFGKQLMTFVPFISFPYDVIGFPDFIKNNGTLGIEGESFSSNSFAFSYSIFGHIGPLIFLTFFLIVLMFLAHLLFKNKLRKRFIPLISTIIALLVVYFARSDLIYFIGLVRGVVILEIGILLSERILLYASLSIAIRKNTFKKLLK